MSAGRRTLRLVRDLPLRVLLYGYLADRWALTRGTVAAKPESRGAAEHVG